jgi:hypothetical protein
MFATTIRFFQTRADASAASSPGALILDVTRYRTQTIAGDDQHDEDLDEGDE